jgi:hypothetical protein
LHFPIRSEVDLKEISAHHPGFQSWLERWNKKTNNRAIFSPEALNKRYNSFREVIPNITID